MIIKENTDRLSVIVSASNVEKLLKILALITGIGCTLEFNLINQKCTFFSYLSTILRQGMEVSHHHQILHKLLLI
jgi:hypothetical protein